MHSSRFPCRVCGCLTDGHDVYVICLACAEEYDLRHGCSLPAALESDSPASGSTAAVPLSPDEIEARLKHLLDDW